MLKGQALIIFFFRMNICFSAAGLFLGGKKKELGFTFQNVSFLFVSGEQGSFVCLVVSALSKPRRTFWKLVAGCYLFLSCFYSGEELWMSTDFWSLDMSCKKRERIGWVVIYWYVGRMSTRAGRKSSFRLARMFFVFIPIQLNMLDIKREADSIAFGG